jgi:general secretion pathway protein M
MFETLLQQPAINKLHERYQGFYQSLSTRDQLLLKVLAVFLLLVLLINSVLMPAYNYASSAQQQYIESTDTLAWMEANRYRVTSKAPSTDGSSLLAVANESSQRFQISFKRFEPVGENGLNLWVEMVPFNNLVEWLADLEQRHNIQIKEIAVDRQDASGQVNARLVLEA